MRFLYLEYPRYTDLMNFREQLKTKTASAHHELDSLPELANYASGRASKTEYHHVLKSFLDFYLSFAPETSNFSNAFHDYRKNYILALRDDLKEIGGEVPQPPQAPSKVEEVSYFYLLLGSSMGASRIVKNYGDSPLPTRHLQISQKEGIKLWPEFIQRLKDFEGDQNKVCDTAVQLFSGLQKRLTS